MQLPNMGNTLSLNDIYTRATNESEVEKNNAKDIISSSKLMKQTENRVNKHACRNRVSCAGIAQN